jgi:hypothetical protein
VVSDRYGYIPFGVHLAFKCRSSWRHFLCSFLFYNRVVFFSNDNLRNIGRLFENDRPFLSISVDILMDSEGVNSKNKA